ncbi:SagB/ThcOx family dehydrogenase [Methanobacterium sp.]|jgi:SagB-type dehydrogenase family enzyme|uniref:SagB/ThcOx family dehydrogenase n=1 Tax=Methanobacterium sp. TaxID=2164 RepID=UPI0031587D27
MSRKGKIILIILIILLGVTIAYLVWPQSATTSNSQRTVISTINLPSPILDGNVSVEQAIQNRRSVRHYTNQSITLQDVSQLMWAAQGITDKANNLRSVPSGGQVYPLEVYIIVGKDGVTGLSEGIYHYNPYNNTLEKTSESDARSDLSQAANGQAWVKEAPVDIVITGDYSKMVAKYKDETLCTRFVNLEAGHAGENIYLEAEARGLVTVALGSFKDDQVHTVLGLPENENTIYIYPVGYSAYNT